MILALIRGSDEKHAAETRTKGVVGHTGNNRPIAPSPRNKNPKPLSTIDFKYKESQHFSYYYWIYFKERINFCRYFSIFVANINCKHIYRTNHFYIDYYIIQLLPAGQDRLFP